MGNAVRKELILQGLECANCASKIEMEVNKISGVNFANINFATKILTVEMKSNEDVENTISLIRHAVNKYEPDVIMSEKKIDRIDKRIIVLMGLNCANCASIIENRAKNITGVGSAHLDFVSKRLVLEIENKGEFDRIFDEVKHIVKSVEPDVSLNVIEDGTVHEYHVEKVRLKEKNFKKGELIQIISGVILFAAASVFPIPSVVKDILFLVSFLLSGWKVLFRAGKNITRGRVFDENFLMSVATIGAFSIKQFPEGAAVMLFYRVGEFIQGIAVNRSRKSISQLMDIRPDYANLKSDGDIRKVSPQEVRIGDTILVKPGEKIPLDGRVVEGESLVDTSALTGEPVPRAVKEGDEVLSGCINKNSILTVSVTREFEESTVSKILDLVQNASSRKSPTENFITKFARYYTPAVVTVAALIAVLPPLLIRGALFSQWVYRALIFLVVSCPCALVISIPLGFFGGIGCASRKGILVKGSSYLEALDNAGIVVFDKTGTLTKGTFDVAEIMCEEGFTKDELMEYAAYAECYSSHPIAESIKRAYGREIDKDRIRSYDDISGLGIKARVLDRCLLAGNKKLMDCENITMQEADASGSIVYIAVDGVYAGYIVVSDTIKKDSPAAVKGLKKAGVKRVVMLTGDRSTAAKKVSEEIGIDEVYPELLPDGKVEKMEEIIKDKPQNKKLVFVGDGVNDAPVLARADIGVAMGALGSDAAIEAADIVIMDDMPSKLVTAIRIAARTKKIVMQNIIFALSVKAVVLLLGALGMAAIWEAVFADVGVTVIAVINSMRALRPDNI